MTRERRQELTDEVINIQNLSKNLNRDIVSFTGFFTTEEEFQRHIEANR